MSMLPWVRCYGLAVTLLFGTQAAPASERSAGPQPVGLRASAGSGGKAVIDGPRRATVGDLVVLDASSSGGDAFAWVLVCEDARKRLLAVDGGRRCVFASGTPGKYVFVLAAVTGGELSVTTHTLQVSSAGPSPPPEPEPGPGPLPTPLPDGKYCLAAFARDSASTLVALPPARLRQTAESLANSFASIASAIAAGTLRDASAILTATREANNAALGDDREAWQSWGAGLAKKLQELHEAKRLATANDYKDAWTEIATGLRAAGVSRRQ